MMKLLKAFLELINELSRAFLDYVIIRTVYLCGEKKESQFNSQS